MKGNIDEGIEEMIKIESGEAICEPGGCKEGFFARGLDCSDKIGVDLINAVVKVTKKPIDRVMIKYGKFMNYNTLRKYYRTHFESVGKTAISKNDPDCIMEGKFL